MTRMVTLRVEAGIEAARLARTRALDRDGDGEALAQLDAEGPWILVARRSLLRRRLAGRALLVWRVACEDAAGRVVESRLVALAVETSPFASRSRRADRVAWLRGLETSAGALVDAVAHDWRETAGGMARSFLAARLAREIATAATADGGADGYQPGLFDRRAEQAHARAAGAGADRQREAAERVALLARSAELIVRPARLLLVVVP